MTRLTSKETAGGLLAKIEEILGETQLNILGKYELMDGKRVVGIVNSVQVRYPRSTKNVARRLVKESGIEVVVDPNPNINLVRMDANARRSNKYFRIVLDQHDPTGSLVEAIEALTASRELHIVDFEVREVIEKTDGSGMLPARAILYHLQGHFIKANSTI